jgi:hypothetical protein
MTLYLPTGKQLGPIWCLQSVSTPAWGVYVVKNVSQEMISGNKLKKLTIIDTSFLAMQPRGPVGLVRGVKQETIRDPDS